MISAESIKHLAESKAQSKALKMEKEAEAYREKMELEADNESNILRQNGETRYNVA